MGKKRNIDNSVDSLFEAMQEVYRDCDEQKRKIMSAIKTRKAAYPADDVEDEAKMGKLELDGMKLLNDIIDKKIKVIVLHSKIVGVTPEESKGVDTSKIGLSAAEIKALTIVATEEAAKNLKYDLSDKK